MFISKFNTFLNASLELWYCERVNKWQILSNIIIKSKFNRHARD